MVGLSVSVGLIEGPRPAAYSGNVSRKGARPLAAHPFRLPSASRCAAAAFCGFRGFFEVTLLQSGGAAPRRTPWSRSARDGAVFFMVAAAFGRAGASGAWVVDVGGGVAPFKLLCCCRGALPPVEPPGRGARATARCFSWFGAAFGRAGASGAWVSDVGGGAAPFKLLCCCRGALPPVEPPGRGARAAARCFSWFGAAFGRAGAWGAWVRPLAGWGGRCCRPCPCPLAYSGCIVWWWKLQMILPVFASVSRARMAVGLLLNSCCVLFIRFSSLSALPLTVVVVLSHAITVST